jgi:phospholipid/cholesterol/gamma-HCH transport system ATP-binding protein
LIRLEDVYLTLGDQLILKGITLEVEKGGTGVILGASGSGKTTILRVVLGLYRVDSGRVLVDGEDITRMEEDDLYRVRAKMGMVFQGGALFDSLTVGENVGYRLSEQRLMDEPAIEGRVRGSLKFVGLEEAIDLMPAELSGGMKKRAGLARALALDPELLFLDEPTSGLDPIGAGAFDELIAELSASLGLTVFMITHDLDSLYAITDRVAVLADRKVVATAPVAELEKSDHPWIQEYFLGPRGRAARAAKARTEP